MIATWIKDIKGQLIKVDNVTRFAISERHIDGRSNNPIECYPVGAITSGVGGRDNWHTLTEAKTEKGAQKYTTSLGQATGGIVGDE